MGAVANKPNVRRNWFRTKDVPTVIAGPCSVESEEQLMETARNLAATGLVDMIRGGIWKPRTRPGTFEGIGVKGLPWMKRVKTETGLPITVEAAKAGHAHMCLEFDVDVIWIGARTTVNPFAVQEVAEALRGVDIPVLVKNPIHPDLSLWMGAVERFERCIGPNRNKVWRIDDAVRRMNQLIETLLHGLPHAQSGQVEPRTVLVQDPQHHPLTVLRRQARDAHVDCAVTHPQ